MVNAGIDTDEGGKKDAQTEEKMIRQLMLTVA